ncbi:hypothetical protein Sjap_014106 [Stephania japonica]|uniref:Uncharacterized protein n=1 Tax=Stephania japonica TaxID=461633 RepID=A0AAP0IZ58_9MAGN
MATRLFEQVRRRGRGRTREEGGRKSKRQIVHMWVHSYRVYNNVRSAQWLHICVVMSVVALQVHPQCCNQNGSSQQK